MLDGKLFLVSTDPVASKDLRALVGGRAVDLQSFDSIEEFLKHGDPDCAACLVLDLRRPDASARGPAEPIRAEQVTLPVICVTGSSKLALRAAVGDELEDRDTRSGLLGLVMRVLDAASAALRARSAHSGIASRLLDLTPRERQVMEGVVRGLSNKMIAQELGISSRTIEIHRAHVMAKIGAESLTDLVRMAFAVGAVGAPERAEDIEPED